MGIVLAHGVQLVEQVGVKLKKSCPGCISEAMKYGMFTLNGNSGWDGCVQIYGMI